MRIALLGTRGVPARYGGFETAIEEIGPRLVEFGHEVTVYRRAEGDPVDDGVPYRGMSLVTLPCVRSKAVETLSHTAVSVAHLSSRPKPDAAIVFNAANSVFLPALRMRGIPVATHVDGLEWKRAKWGGAAKRYYRRAEELAVRWSDALIADAQGIADYYRGEFDVATELIAYGAPVLTGLGHDRLAEIGLAPRGYHLVVARFEPENHVDMIVAGYRASSSELPLIVVGGAPYADEYGAKIDGLASGDARVRILGSVWDQALLDQLYANAFTYIHGHSVGGTNPSLLRAMGAGAPVVAFDVAFNRDVVRSDARFFDDPESLARELVAAEEDAIGTAAMGGRGQETVSLHYQWDEVARDYSDLVARLAAGYSVHGTATGRRKPGVQASR